MAMSRLARAGVLAAYTAAFWVALPAVLWKAAQVLDAALGWPAPRRPAGWLLAAAGLGLVAWSMAELWRTGRGLPVSALPPPWLATRGPYRLCRHPIYLGYDLAVLGVGLGVGSPSLAWIVAPLLAPAWLLYAAVEERGLERRFGERYRFYRRLAGMLPRPGLYLLARALVWAGLLPHRVEGRERIPRRGGAVLVANHASYVDFLYLVAAAPRRVCLLVTAEAFRHPLRRALMKGGVAVPVRRYRVDPRAARAVFRLVEAGELVAVHVEGERSTLGRLLPPLPGAARLLSRLGAPIIPVGISGSYDVGPRWAGVLRRRPVTVRVGPPLHLAGSEPAEAISRALAALVRPDPQPVHLEGLPRERLAAVLWRCPRCLAEPPWRPAALRCEGCGAGWQATTEGLLSGPAGPPRTLAEVAAPVWAAPEPGPLRMEVEGFRERSLTGPIEPLQPLGRGTLLVESGALRFGDLVVPLHRLRSTSTEHADTLQVATADGMWQFRAESGSVFRLQLAVDRWRGAGAPRLAGRPDGRRRRAP